MRAKKLNYFYFTGHKIKISVNLLFLIIIRKFSHLF